MLGDKLRIGAGAAVVLVIGAVAGAAVTNAVQPAPAAQVAIAEASASSELYVDVQGAVERPGIVMLSPGARVIDAVAAAGGMTDAAAAGSVNLAREVVDGEQLVVPDVTAHEKGADDGLVSINSATAEELQSLSGIGPALSGAIVAYREEHGPFTDIAQLEEVPGIGPAMMSRLESAVKL